MLTLAITKREKTGKTARHYDEGYIPAVFYGPKEASTPVSLSKSDFLRVWREVGESSVISLTGVNDAKEVLIHDVDIDPVGGGVRHVDFYVIEKGKKIEVEVPLVFTGEAPAVKELGGALVKVLHEILIEAMPKDLPQEISVDVTGLVNFESRLSVGDLALPSGVSTLLKEDEIVALVTEVKEEEEVLTDTPDLDSIEVEEKGKVKPSEGGETAESTDKQ